MATKNMATQAELLILLTNIDIVSDAIKVTKKELDELNTRISTELSHKPYQQYESKLVNALLLQHQKVLNQYNSEHQLLESLKTKLTVELEKQLNAGIISLDDNGKISIAKPHTSMNESVHANESMDCKQDYKMDYDEQKTNNFKNNNRYKNLKHINHICSNNSVSSEMKRRNTMSINSIKSLTPN
eukprot:402768_1